MLKKTTSAVLLFACFGQIAYGNPYGDEYLKEHIVPDGFRVPNVKSEQWKAVDVRNKFANFVDAESIFFTAERVYYSVSTRILTEARKVPFSERLTPDSPYGMELGGRYELDCAMAKKRVHDMTFGDYFLGGRGNPLEGSGQFERASPAEISLFCTGNKERALKKLSELDRANRPKISGNLFGRYDK